MGSDKGVSAFPDGDNLFRWKGTIEGADDTVSKQWVVLMLVQHCRQWVNLKPNIWTLSSVYYDASIW